MESSPSLIPRVLLVDDDSSFHRLVKSVLDPAGIAYVGVRSGEEALAFCETEKPSLVIIDGLLPGLRGDEVSAKLRWKWPKEDLYLLFVSAFFRDIASRQRLLQTVGVDAILHKPVTPERLRRALSCVPGLEKHTSPQSVPELQLGMTVELLRDYLVVSEEAISQIRESLLALNGPSASQALVSLRNAVHRFAGTGASFGLPEVSRVAKQLELWLDAHSQIPMADATRARVVGLVEALEVRLRHAKESEDVTPALTTRQLSIVLVDGPGDLAMSCGEAASFGAPLRMFADPDAAYASAKENPADVYFIAADDSHFDGHEVARKWAKADIGPVVLLGRDESLQARLKAEAAASIGYVPRVADVEMLFEVAAQFAGIPKGLVGLVLGSDSRRLGEISEALLGANISLLPVNSVEELLKSISVMEPALVVLVAPVAKVATDVEWPSILRLLRNDLRLNETPMVMWLDDDQSATRLQALKAGADAVISNGGGLDEFQWQVRALLRSRANHFRKIQNSRRNPRLTRPVFMAELDVALSLAKRGRPLSVVVFEVDAAPMARWVDGYQKQSYLSSVAHAIRRGFRQSDLMATLAIGRFALLLYDADKANATRLVESVVSLLHGPENAERLGGATVRAAAVSFPDFSGDAEAMVEQALTLVEPMHPQ